MNKIIIAFDATNFSHGALEFVIRRHAKHPCEVKAYFLMPKSDTSVLGYQLVPKETLLVPTVAEDDDTVLKNVNFFTTKCEEHNIHFTIHSVSNVSPFADMIEETRFSDLLVLGVDTFFANAAEDIHDSYLAEILHTTECPVFLVTNDYFLPASIVFCYDGSESSMFAIKHFCYLLPEMHNRMVQLVYATENENDEIPGMIDVEDYLKVHFDHIKITKLHTDPKKYFYTWISGKEYAILVAGAFGRTGMSEVFRSSFAGQVVNDRKVPVFIAHK